MEQKSANTESAPGRPSPKTGARRRERPTRHDTDECLKNAHWSNTCMWPECDKVKAFLSGGRDHFPSWLPLCLGHVFEVWRLARDHADTHNNRAKTLTTVVAGETKTIERPVSRIGWVYYIRIGNEVKVGYASNLLNRLRSYPPTAEFLHANRGTKNDEKVAHSMLYLHRVAAREWYAPHADVFTYIEQQKARHGTVADPRVKKKPDPMDPANYPRPRFVRG